MRSPMPSTEVSTWVAPAAKRAVGVGDGAAGIIVAVKFNVARYDTAQGSHQVMHLQGRGDANGIGDPDPVHSDLIDLAVDGQQIDQVAAEGVLAAETHFQSLALDKLDNLHRAVDDLADRLAMREFSQIAAGAKEDVDAVNAGVYGQAGIVEMAARMGEQLGAQPQAGDARAVSAALGAGSRRGQLQILDAEGIQQMGDLDFLPAVEECIGELLALTQR